VSNDTYLKIYDVNSSLAKKDKTILENKIDSLNKKPSTPFGTDLPSIQPPFHPNFPIFPSKPF